MDLSILIETAIIPIILHFIPGISPEIKFQLFIIVRYLLNSNSISQIFKWIPWITRQPNYIIIRDSNDGIINRMYNTILRYITEKYNNKLKGYNISLHENSNKYHLNPDINEKNNIIDTYNKHTIHINFKQEKGNDMFINTIIIESRTATIQELRDYCQTIVDWEIENRAQGRNYISVWQMKLVRYGDNSKWEWCFSTPTTNKTVLNTVYSREIEEKLFADIRHFIDSEPKYRNKGRPYKRSYFLYSAPGMGKSSVAKILAVMYRIPIFVLDINRIPDNESMATLMDSIKSNNSQMNRTHILLIEDIDTADIIRNPQKSGITMSTFLNELDGVLEWYGQILIMTANDPTMVMNNEALRRNGRIDCILELKPTDADQITRLCKFHYETSIIDWFSINLPTLSGAVITELLFKCKNEHELLREIQAMKV